ncbi:hypothetical protein C1X34_11990 [Pseudomonas sp. GW456-12-10-14-TSB6]|nr:hypothetical protein C1X55_19400 [Pseudomonas sp. GW460-C8]PMW23407.1 hypothetical protein C1X53_12700 [Pseudomonas sp. GW456-E6]PMW24117.1 hypothetical protein C1X40_04685 [Pseudomonas sp. GW456-11-11-14-TSB2]PMW40011.1 hypothetical protein C1X45_07995 [Pseudomonas sp. GW460-7]PMW41122.1 hypothetical protein C1X48_06630 [Pseudomonas sp. FW305-3-2-15-A-R2A1]PMW62715.1 hypothetical protein C1X39_03615 [Pseudomonas sp. GW456-12-1-14-TSB1]PMW68168.1 hypothetical protein C1X31_01730 [Pseudomon
MPDEAVINAVAQWKSEKPMSKVLPLRFADGTRLDHLEIDCANCARVLRAQHQRGMVCMVMADTYRLKGLAACDQCRSFTRFSFLCSGTDGVVTVEWKKGGRVERTQVRATWLTRLAAWLSRRT